NQAATKGAVTREIYAVIPLAHFYFPNSHGRFSTLFRHIVSRYIPCIIAYLIAEAGSLYLLALARGLFPWTRWLLTITWNFRYRIQALRFENYYSALH
ncbi:MAG: hypothetical protein HOB98_10810, partial [Gammaproteobacteria bacterium]|nr:hypothetical protein [Gammaproteobacteria bacterium]